MEEGGGKPAGRPFLKRKIVIGSKHLRMQYKVSGEHAFHPSDVPRRARTARDAAREWKKPSTLKALTKPTWNGSTATGVPACRREARQLSIHDNPEFQYNYRAEELPNPREVSVDAFGRSKLLPTGAASRQGHVRKAAEAPIHHALEGKRSFDTSTALKGEKWRSSLTADLTKRALAASRSRARRIASRANGYLTPQEREGARMVALRAQRAATAKAIVRGGPVPPEDWMAHFTSSTTAAGGAGGGQAGPAWTSRALWAPPASTSSSQEGGGGGPAAEPLFRGTPAPPPPAFGSTSAAAADAALAAMLGAAPGTAPAGASRASLRSGGSAYWQAGYWAEHYPPNPNVQAVEAVLGEGALRGTRSVKPAVVPPEYTLPH